MIGSTLAQVCECPLAGAQWSAGERAALDRRVGACDRLTMQAAEHKVRLKTWSGS